MSASTSFPSLAYLTEQQRFRPNAHRDNTAPKLIEDLKATSAESARKMLAVPMPQASGQRVTPTMHLNLSAHAGRRVEGTQQPQVAEQPTHIDDVFARQFTKRAPRPLVKRSLLRRWASIMLPAMALAVGIVIFSFTIHQNKQAVAQVNKITEKAAAAGGASEGAPSEAPVSSGTIRKYSVSPELPKTIRIPGIKVYARVLSMGILSSGALATPRNTNDTGWYNGSSKPGEDGGAMLVVGHVSGMTGVGVFYNLKKLNAGDTMTVERGDGQAYTYRVVKKEVVSADKVDMSDLLISVTPGKAGLNLMTCTGKYNAKEETFNEREIVYTERI